MDDAGGGRRGARAAVSGRMWEVLAAWWAIPRQRERDLGGGVNLNLLVHRGNDQLVVRVYRPSLSPARLKDIQAVRDRLDDAGVPCSALVPARDGTRWAQITGRLLEVERFIPRHAQRQSLDTPNGASRPGCAGRHRPPGGSRPTARPRSHSRHTGPGRARPG